jgi:hypothetical protein
MPSLIQIGTSGLASVAATPLLNRVIAKPTCVKASYWASSGAISTVTLCVCASRPATLGHSTASTTLNIYSHVLPGAGSPGADAFHAMSNDSKGVASEPAEAGARPDAGSMSGGVGMATNGSPDAPEPFPAASNVVAINTTR